MEGASGEERPRSLANSLHPRLSRIFSARIEPIPRLSGLTVWALSGWIGLACGLVESLVQLTWRRFEHRLANPDLWVNWQGPWMAPLSLALGFLGLGMVLGLARGFAPRVSNRVAPIVLFALGAWSILGVLPGMNPWALNFFVAVFAFRVGRLARFDSSGFQRLARRSFPILAGLWFVLFLATGILPAVSESWSLRSAQIPPKDAPNVLLVVLDTVRADNLSLFGYGRATSPRLGEWARRGVRFDQARSTTSYTLGTHASLFTGHWMSETSARVNAPLDGRRPTLAEHLRDRGYATGGFVGNIFYGSAHYGLDRGFLRYHDIPDNILRRATPREFLRSSRLGDSLVTWFELKWRIFVPMQRLRLDGDELNREALAWAEGTRTIGRPFFLFMNYFDAHSPYSLPGEAPQPFSRLTTDNLEARMKRLEQVEEHLDAHPSPTDAAEVARLQADVYSHLKNAYDDGIAWTDRKLDELLRGLERRGLLENTVVVVTADHGEMLGEHEVIGHGKGLHRQVVHVPLVVIDPRAIAGRSVVTRPVSLRDIPATILDLVGDPDPRRFPGWSLRRHWVEGEAGPDPVELARTPESAGPSSSPLPPGEGPGVRAVARLSTPESMRLPSHRWHHDPHPGPLPGGEGGRSDPGSPLRSPPPLWGRVRGGAVLPITIGTGLSLWSPPPLRGRVRVGGREERPAAPETDSSERHRWSDVPPPRPSPARGEGTGTEANPPTDEPPVLSEVEHLSWRRHTHRTPAAFGPSWLLTEGRWSYHRQAHETLGTQEHLFNLSEDPGEAHDLAPDPAHRGTLEALRKRLDAALPPKAGG